MKILGYICLIPIVSILIWELYEVTLLVIESIRKQPMEAAKYGGVFGLTMFGIYLLI